MDHLPHFTDPAHGLPKLRYRGETEPYDGKGFWNYPERRGWSLEGLELGLRMGSAQVLLHTPPARYTPGNSVPDPEEYAQLLQSWWYFGMLHETLGDLYQLEDYVTDNPEAPGERLVTTVNLKKILQAWWERMKVMSRQDALAKLLEIMKCINWVHQILEIVGTRIEKFRLAPENEFRAVIGIFPPAIDGKPEINMGPFTGGLETSFWRRAGRKILPKHLELSICILGYTLSHAAKSVYYKLALGNPPEFDIPSWYCPEFVYRRMNICPTQVERFRPQLQIISGYLASFLNRPSGRTDHESCTSIRCVADNIKPEIYKRAHACIEGDVPCPSGPSMAGPEFKKVLEILDAGHIPVVRVRSDVSAGAMGVHIEVLPAHLCSKYVAISHVWADGLGNVHSNELFKCQWERLQNLVQQSLHTTKGTDILPDSDDTLVPF